MAPFFYLLLSTLSVLPALTLAAPTASSGNLIARQDEVTSDTTTDTTTVEEPVVEETSVDPNEVVDISTQLLPFLDYESIQDAALDAVASELRRRGLSDLADHSFGKERRSLGCPRVSKRKEWRQLSTTDKKAYLKATKCLQNKPDFGISPISDS